MLAHTFIDVSLALDAFNGTPTFCPTGTECPAGVECYNDVCLQGTIPDADMVAIACAPNRVVNFSDVQAVMDAFHSYPFTQSPGCAEVCTGAALPLAPANPYYFTGRRLDLACGPLDGAGDGGLVLYHYRARAYDARDGRVVRKEPWKESPDDQEAPRQHARGVTAILVDLGYVHGPVITRSCFAYVSDSRPLRASGSIDIFSGRPAGRGAHYGVSAPLTQREPSRGAD